MNAKEISDATLPTVTPADDDLMLIYDTSEGTTGKATIADVVKKVSDIGHLKLNTPVMKKQNDTTEGGEIVFESGGTSDLDSVFIDVYENVIRIRAEINNSMNVFNIDFENKTTYWT